MTLWQTGDVVGPTNLNLKGASALTLAGFSTNTMQAESGNTVAFLDAVVLPSIDSGGAVYNVKAFGAVGNGVADDTNAILNTISIASNAGGGTVYLPAGGYVISSPLTLPPFSNTQVRLRGEGRRRTSIQVTGSCCTGIVSGSTAVLNNYPELSDFDVVGRGSGDTHCGIWLARPRFGVFNNITVESFNSGYGFYVEGDGTTGGAWRNKFYNVLTAAVAGGAIFHDADENGFYGCNFGLVVGSTSVVTALEIQGRNNRLYDLLLSGDDVVSERVKYTGLLFSNRTDGGDVSGNQVYGMVAEGFDSGISIGSGVTNTWIMNYNTSINSVSLNDAGTGTIYLAPQESTFAPIFQWPSGSIAAPAFAFRSEGSLGWYRSTTSTMALAPEGRLVVGSGTAFSATTQPEYGFGGEPQLGIRRSGASGVDVVAAGLRLGRFGASGNLGFLGVEVGSQTTPGIQWNLEPALGLYRSGTSTVALSYGTLNLRGAALSLRTTASSASASNLTQGEICLVAVSTTSAQLAFKSGNTVYVFNAVQASS